MNHYNKNSFVSIASETTNDMKTENKATASYAPVNDDSKAAAATKPEAETKTTPPTTSTTTTSRFLTLLRILLLDLPLVVLFASYVSLVVLEQVHDTYFEKQFRLMYYWGNEAKRTEKQVTYYHRTCTPHDITTNSTDDLIFQYPSPYIESDDSTSASDLPPPPTPTQAKEHMLHHGVSIYPNILSDDIADELRAFVLKQNTIEENFYVIEAKHRYTFGVRVDHHPAVTKALTQIATHPVFRPSINAIVGDVNPAIIEFTAITSMNGAIDQFLHHDILPESNTAKWVRQFLPSYSLFITLQDTSVSMGVTEICPGSHICAEGGLDVMCTEDTVIPAVNSNGIWPKAAGALVNQQTVHRGTAHYDPKPDGARSLFILTFAPRPQTGNYFWYTNLVLPSSAPLPRKKVVETRLFSFGGSYSIHGTQWGHTIDDFGSSATQMKQPFRTMRSLGLFNKSPKQQWGWDMITTASMRIVNFENGYGEEELERFLVKGGIWKLLLPTVVLEYLEWNNPFNTTLNTDVSNDYEDDDDEEEKKIMDPKLEKLVNDGWAKYMLNTMKSVRTNIGMVNAIGLAIYLGLVALVQSVLVLFGNKNSTNKNMLYYTFRRLILVYLAIIIFACHCFGNLSTTNWAQNLQNNKTYIVPTRMIPNNLNHEMNRDDHTIVSPFYFPIDKTASSPNRHHQKPRLFSKNRATLPNTHDILNKANYQSKSLGSLQDIFDYTHPGNEKWKALLLDHSVGYLDLSQSMRQSLCSNLVEYAKHNNHARFLIQSYSTNSAHLVAGHQWVAVHNKKLVEKYVCHKDMLLYLSKNEENDVAASDKMFGRLLQEIDDLYAESKFQSTFREMSIHKYHTPALLRHWENFVLDLVPIASSTPKKLTNAKTTKTKKNNVFRVQPKAKLVLNRNTTKTRGNEKGQRPILPLPPLKEPYPGAWLAVGDVVEAQYEGNFNEWYNGYIFNLSPNRAMYDVTYSDGDVQRNLKRSNIRPFRPFDVKDHVEVRIIIRKAPRKHQSRHYANDDDAEDEFWVPGRIVHKYRNPNSPYYHTYDIVTDEYGLQRYVPISNIRRRDVLAVGTRVEVGFDDGNDYNWYNGAIAKINYLPNHDRVLSYDILFDDGITDKELPPDGIRYEYSDLQTIHY